LLGTSKERQKKIDTGKHPNDQKNSKKRPFLNLARILNNIIPSGAISQPGCSSQTNIFAKTDISDAISCRYTIAITNKIDYDISRQTHLHLFGITGFGYDKMGEMKDMF
jgi:hypothetical protein